jgi:amidase
MLKGWEAIAADKRRRLRNIIVPEWRVDTAPSDSTTVMQYPERSGVLSAQEIEITNSSAVDLIAKLAARELTSVDVTLAFCKRAAVAHQLGWHHVQVKRTDSNLRIVR